LDIIELYFGIDVSAETLAVSLFTKPGQSLVTRDNFENSLAGFKQLLEWVRQNRATCTNSVFCLEATGVYGEALSYYLQAQGFRIAIEPPLKVKRAFQLNGRKTDAVDSQQIAEYAYRFQDELNFWKPNQDAVEQIKVMLTLWDQFTGQVTSNQNALKAFQRKPVKTPLAEKLLMENIERLKANKKAVEKEIKRLVESEPSYKDTVRVLISVPGIGILLAASLLVFSGGFSRELSPRKLASFLGICPFEHKSGSSIDRKPHSRGFGPGRMRKLLHLAARSVVTHKPAFRAYFHRKVEQGKPKLLVLNNVGNKILKIACALVKAKTSYIPEYRSVNPAILKKAA